MASALLGDYRWDPLLNEFVGEVSQENVSSGLSIDVKKPLRLEFYQNEAFDEALIVEGKVKITLDTRLDSSLSVQENADIGGNLVVTGTVSSDQFCTTSDQRLKTEITPILNVSSSDVKTYKYKLKGNDKLFYGVIAQDLLKNKQFQHLVTYNPETKYYSVDYIQFIPILMNDIRALKKLTYACCTVSIFSILMHLF
jgi:hypothetical protein